MFIDGSVSLISGNQSVFNGMLYVNGNLIMRQTSDIRGAVVCTGSLNLQGSGDYATITYDDDILMALRAEFGQYRWSGALRPIINQE